MKLLQKHTVCSMVAVALIAIQTASFSDTLKVFPEQVQLDNARDPHRIVALLTRDDGVTLDVTSQVQVSIEPEGVAAWDAAGLVRPVADGDGKITIVHGEQRVEVSLKIQQAAVDPPISFRNDIEPVLMRAGCNTGSCHGSARGKNGFHLSLFGYDPAKDYLTLTREARGRRLSAATSDESLMLLKPQGDVDHDGGIRFEESSPAYGILERWIAEGAKDDPAEIATLAGIDIYPREVVLEGAGTKQQFIVQARYSDGTDRDVTELAVLSSVDDSVVAVDDYGVATSGRRGEAYIMARYGSFAVVGQVLAIPAAEPVRPPPSAPKNYIDELVYGKHKKLRIAATGQTTDPVFLRRVYLDVLGVLPTVEEARAFLTDTSEDKRERLVDSLLERPEFNDLWTMRWAEILRVRSSDTLDRKGMFRYNDWLRQSIQNGKPIDQMARELLTSTGGNFTSPAANFYLVEREPVTMSENVAQIFMGVQIKCAQCHNHPFDRWTMDDYYSFAAFFSQVGRKGSSDPRETIVYNSGSGEVKNLRNGQVMQPKFLGGAVPDLAGRDRREVLAEWLTSDENPWFAKNIANRVWQQFFGQGVIDPADDVRVSNPPSNPHLHEELGRRLIAYEYDFRKLIRDICLSNAYQMDTQATESAEGDMRNFAYAQIRRLPSEMLLDAISSVTESKVKFGSLPLGSRAVQVADGPSGNYFLEVFGRPSRETACTCERRNEPTLAQVLHLINGGTMSTAIGAGEGRLAKTIAQEKDTGTAIEELYLAAYARVPSEEESTKLLNYVDSAEDKRAALEDVYWSVLNSKEFVFNH